MAVVLMEVIYSQQIIWHVHQMFQLLIAAFFDDEE